MKKVFSVCFFLPMFWDSNCVSVEPASEAVVLVDLHDISNSFLLSKKKHIIRCKQLIPLCCSDRKDLS
jgi:hypothetical protein